MLRKAAEVKTRVGYQRGGRRKTGRTFRRENFLAFLVRELKVDQRQVWEKGWLATPITDPAYCRCSGAAGWERTGARACWVLGSRKRGVQGDSVEERPVIGVKRIEKEVKKREKFLVKFDETENNVLKLLLQ